MKHNFKTGFFLALAFSLGAFFSSPACAETGLLGNWKFEEGSGAVAADSSGNGNSGVISGAAFVTGKAGKGLSFDGTNDQVTVPNNTTFQNLKEITVSAWIFPSSGTSAGDDMIVSKGGTWDLDSSFQFSYTQSLKRVGVAIRYGKNSGDTVQATLDNITPDQWTHVAFTLNDLGYLKLFINGEQKQVYYTNLKTDQEMQSSDRDIVFGGAATDGGGRFFQGKIDEVKIYSRALSEDEIRENAGLSPKEPKTLKNLAYWGGYNLMHFSKIDASVLNNVKDSPFDSYLLPLYPGDDYTLPVRSFDSFQNNIALIKNQKKKFFPRTRMLDISGYCDAGDAEKYSCDCLVKPNPPKNMVEEYYLKNEYLNLWNKNGILDTWYERIRLATKLAKESGSNGIGLDAEMYNGGCFYSVPYLAAKMGKTEAEVVQKAKDVGHEIADIINEENPNTLIYTTFADIAAPNAPVYIYEGMLERAKEKSYHLKLFEGGENTVGYMPYSLDDLQNNVLKRNDKLASYLSKYPNFELAGLSCPYSSPSDLSAYYYGRVQYANDNKIPFGFNSGADFVKSEKWLFSNFEYNWVYFEPANYNDYIASDPITVKTRAILRTALCGNGACEENRAETATSCPADCSGTPTFKNTDLNQDNLINVVDLGILMSDFMKAAANLTNPRSDINGDGQCNIKDVGIMMGEWE